MAMTQFEKALINELQGIRKELHELNRIDSKPVTIYAGGVATDIGALINNSMRERIIREEISSPMLKSFNT